MNGLKKCYFVIFLKVLCFLRMSVFAKYNLKFFLETKIKAQYYSKSSEKFIYYSPIPINSFMFITVQVQPDFLFVWQLHGVLLWAFILFHVYFEINKNKWKHCCIINSHLIANILTISLLVPDFLQILCVPTCSLLSSK